ncbi:hypothetical protein MSBRW_3722 [Methanosarcina barkeri str. Wiesmoor]|uniref:Uncharacterized protein n=1 Tax=Methanosarcina barkeri str. Wiesmoor TaxID=1434109 RepID=A0A0E3QR78_METBA|nr:hypothetical protein MSBRW_3722 [Methanosarcina barkeri str. Wiesmoor]
MIKILAGYNVKHVGQYYIEFSPSDILTNFSSSKMAQSLLQEHRDIDLEIIREVYGILVMIRSYMDIAVVIPTP